MTQPIRDSGSDHAEYERAIGIRAHRLIARLCEQDDRDWQRASLSAIRLEAAAMLKELPMRRGRRGAAQRIAFAAWTYCRELLPERRSETSFVGAEVCLGATRIDVVWESGGRVVFDEVKTGAWRGRVTPHNRSQASHALAAGQQAFADRFAGLRFLYLDDATARFWVAPTGAWMPLSLHPSIL
jgi:hypothetical protein